MMVEKGSEERSDPPTHPLVKAFAVSGVISLVVGILTKEFYPDDSPAAWALGSMLFLLGFSCLLWLLMPYVHPHDLYVKRRRAELEDSLKRIEYPQFEKGEGDFFRFAREEAEISSDRIRECQIDQNTFVDFMLEGGRPLRVDRWLEKRELIGESIKPAPIEEPSIEEEVKAIYETRRRRRKAIVKEELTEIQEEEELEAAVREAVQPILEKYPENQRAAREELLVKQKVRELKRAL